MWRRLETTKNNAPSNVFRHIRLNSQFGVSSTRSKRHPIDLVRTTHILQGGTKKSLVALPNYQEIVLNRMPLRLYTGWQWHHRRRHHHHHPVHL